MENQRGISDEDRIDACVEKVAKALPTLKRLQLGAYFRVPREGIWGEREAWGKARRWEGTLEKRYEQGQGLREVKIRRIDRDMMRRGARGTEKASTSGMGDNSIAVGRHIRQDVVGGVTLLS